LEEKSLVLVDLRDGAIRYRMLETVREYAREQLAAAGELAAIRDRHRDWFLQLAEQFAAADRPEQAGWLTRLEAERENLWAALACCEEEATADSESAAAEAGLRLAVALTRFWVHRGYLADGLQWLEDALARSGHLPATLRAPAFLCAAHLAFSRGQRAQSRSFVQAARQEQEKVLALARAQGEGKQVAAAILVLAQVAREMNDIDAAWSYAEEARQQMEASGDRAGLIGAVEVMAHLASWRRDRQAEWPLMEELMALCRELGDTERLVHALGGMGHLARDEGDYARARSLYQESLVLRQKLGYQIALAQSLEDLAALADREGHTERAIRLLGAGEAFCETLGARPPVALVKEYERAVSEGRAALGEAAFAAAWAAGRAMSLDEALAYALGGE
jgi:non-specific serine/threonine protein kinase